jgi:hypothetical protein
MPRDLTASPVDRQNILNNPYAVGEIQKAAQIRGVLFEGTPRVIKEQVAAFFEVDPRTVERCLEQNADELAQNGYEVLRGKRLQEFKLAIERQFVTDIDVGHKAVNLGIFDFRAFLNIGMLLTDSHRARLLRQLVLDIVFDVINQAGRRQRLGHADRGGWPSREPDFAGICGDAVAQEDVVRFAFAIDGDDQLSVGRWVRSRVAENARIGADLGAFQIVAVDEQPQTHFGRMGFSRRLAHGYSAFEK